MVKILPRTFKNRNGGRRNKMIVRQRKVSVPKNLTVVPLHPGAEKRSAVHAAPHHHTQDCNTCVLITAHPVLICPDHGILCSDVAN